MNPHLLIFALAGTITFCSCNESSTTKRDSDLGNKAVFNFKETSYDFGRIQDGDTVVHDFDFVNSGNSPLLINDVSTSCGCTAVEWPKKPIMPHHSGVIKIQFSKKHAPGQHSKTAIIKANTAGSYTVLRIKALISDQEAIVAN